LVCPNGALVGGRLSRVPQDTPVSNHEHVNASRGIAARTGLRPQPFYLGVIFVAMGLGLSAMVVRETKHHVAHESALRGASGREARRSIAIFVPAIERFWRKKT
jgi:hypothetical protein